MILQTLTRIFNGMNPRTAFYLSLALALIILLIALGLIALTIFLSWRMLQKKQTAEYPLRLFNSSNVHTQFHLQTDLDTLKKRVKAIWKLDDSTLKLKTVEQISIVEIEQPQPAAASKKDTKKTGDLKDKAKETRKSAKDKYRFVNSIINTIASIGAALVSIMPGPLKAPFRAVTDSIRGIQQRTAHAIAQPDRMATSASQLNSNVSRLGKSTGAKKKDKKKKGKEGGGDLVDIATQTSQYKRTVTSAYQVIETHPFTPDETTTYTLLLRPRNPFGISKGSFTIKSQQVETSDFPARDGLQPQMLSGNLEIKSPGFAYILLFFTLCISILAFNTWWTLLSIRALLPYLAAV